MQSKITGGQTAFLFKTRILSKYDVSFFKCIETGFVQTEEPYWLDEAYSSAITKLDIGLVKRNIDLAELAHPLIMKFFDHEKSFLDYAGGYGLFTRLMRYKGFDFYHTDKYCENIFAEFNDLKDQPDGKRFELTTAFEVFEHLPDPLPEIEKMLAYSDNLLFSTVLLPKTIPQPGEWWYYSPETGQHVAFYSTASLEFIAKKFNKYFYSNGETVHLFTSRPFPANPFSKLQGSYLVRKLIKKVKKLEASLKGRKLSLLDNDVQAAKKIISQNGS